MRIIDIVIGAIWIAFWIYWFVSAFGTKRSQRRVPHYIGVRIAVAAVVIVVLHTRIGSRFGLPATNPALRGVGLAVFLAGIALAVWARVYLGRNWGVPMSRKLEPELVTSGPYRYVRHPIYTGIILASIGTAVAVSILWLIPTLVLGGYFAFTAKVEDRIMATAFPTTYPAYKGMTKMLIPFIL